MTDDVIKQLEAEKVTPMHEKLLTHAKALIKMSRSKVSQHYSDWDMQDQVYRGLRMPDQDDRRQASKDKPIKMVVPNTFAQVMTFASFLFLMLKQNRTFFELVPTGIEDYGDKQKDCELLLERDLRFNKWDILLFQHLLNVGRFGPAVTECCWTRKISHVYAEQPDTISTYGGVQTTLHNGSEWQQYIKYEGNLVRNISPYKFFYDVRFPLSEFQRGEFCGCEEEFSKGRLRELEQAGEVAGVDRVQPLPADWTKLRGGETRSSITTDKITSWLTGPSQSEGTVIVTKIQIWIVPSKFPIDDQTKLGPEEFPVLYHLWYANDNRIIRLEPAYWWHNEFGWTVSEFTPDMHKTLTYGLADLIYRLQDVISWHINSRITDVRRNLRGRLIVDPTGIDTTSLDGDGDIFIRPGAGKVGLNRFIQPLEMRDVTAAHMSDAEILGKLMQAVTGVNDNLMGQYNTGRRSAQEARTVLGGASGRMKLHGYLIWASGFAPLGKMMLSNLRQSLPFEQFQRTIGTTTDPQVIQQRYAQFQGTPEEIVCGEDYFVFDSTLQSEKGFMAQSLQDLLSTIIQSDPLAAQRMTEGVDPVKVLDEMQYLRGAGDIKRFAYSPEEQQQLQQQRQQMEQAKVAAPQKPPSQSMNYADAPPDVQRQMEAAEGYQPSRLGPDVTTTQPSNGQKGATINVDHSRHVTIQKPGAKK